MAGTPVHSNDALMRLRAVAQTDVDAYIAMRCDPVMMGELGGPQDPAKMPAMVARDVAATATDERWILMILADDEQVAGTVTVYEHDGLAEIGWRSFHPFSAAAWPRPPPARSSTAPHTRIAGTNSTRGRRSPTWPPTRSAERSASVTWGGS